jgi:hypothetical protein
VYSKGGFSLDTKLTNAAKLKSRKNIIDDGFRADLVERASFDGIMEIPHINRPTQIIIPNNLIPFKERDKTKDYNEFVCFYEHDKNFSDCLLATDQFIDDLKSFKGIISPDCSLYWDMPLCLQVANIYMNRAVGYYFQEKGLYVIPNIRWGDERTYTTVELPERVAFLGVDKHSIVSVGTYGCVQSKEAKYHFREGLIAMLDELEPEVVLVYGPMPKKVFEGLYNRTNFVNYPDWITYKKAGGQ